MGVGTKIVVSTMLSAYGMDDEAARWTPMIKSETYKRFAHGLLEYRGLI